MPLPLFAFTYERCLRGSGSGENWGGGSIIMNIWDGLEVEREENFEEDNCLRMEANYYICCILLFAKWLWTIG